MYLAIYVTISQEISRASQKEKITEEEDGNLVLLIGERCQQVGLWLLPRVLGFTASVFTYERSRKLRRIVPIDRKFDYPTYVCK